MKSLRHSFSFSKLSYFINFQGNIFAALVKEHTSKNIFQVLIPQYVLRGKSATYQAIRVFISEFRNYSFLYW